jgi:hypothetical protein
MGGGLGRAAAGARAAATANREANALSRMNPAQRQQFALDKRAKQAAEAEEKHAQALGRSTLAVGIATHAVSNMAGMVSGKMVKGLTAAIGAIKQFAGPIEDLVRLANPARTTRFTMALEDAYAVIGRMLIPVLDSLTGAARKVGDFYAGVEPVIGPVMEKVGEFIERFATRVAEMAQKNAPALEMMADLLLKVGDAAIQAADLLMTAIDRMPHLRLARGLAEAAGYGGKADFTRSSFNAAIRPAQFVGAKNTADEAIKNALTLAATGKQAAKPPEKTLESIESQLEKFFSWAMGGGGKDAKGKAEGPGGFAQDALGWLAQNARQLATQPFR